MRRSAYLLATLLAAASPQLALAQTADSGKIVDELKGGIYDHDASVLGHQKETGADINLEVLFTSPSFLGIIGSPRPMVGGLVNTSGQTDQFYFGLTWDWTFVHDVFASGDGFYVEGSLGGSVHDGKLDVQGAEAQRRKSLGSPVLFREDVDLGYRFAQRYSVAISLNHISDADLAKRNEGLNDVGLRFGYKF
ncbi:MAG TPA: acyloxyacyl hydrolase [Stellaceae bacterium]|nr:acyloxyacyl hydrolase [Stellaceae bacterium]